MRTGLLALLFTVSSIFTVLGFFLFLTPISWDEGWNFCVARNLVEQGHFGCSILGQLTSARLANGWFPILTAAAGFELFGINLVAGRVVITLVSLLAVAVLVQLGRMLGGNRTGAATAGVLLLLSADERIHPLIIGSQVWGEMPMILAVGVGFCALCLAMTHKPLLALGSVVVASVCFGVALQTKVQLQPFLFLGLGLTIVFSVVRGRRREAFILLAALLGGWWCWHHLSPGLPVQPTAPDPAAGTTNAATAIGWVLEPQVRLRSIAFAVSQGWYLMLALGLLGWRFLRQGLRCKALYDQRLEAVFIALVLVVLGWLAWFMLLAIDFARYIAPPLILGAPIVALALRFVTSDFEMRSCFTRWWGILRGPPNVWAKISIVSVLGCALAHGLLVTVDLGKTIIYRYQDPTNADIAAMSRYINTQTPPGSKIETYETMLFFMLERPFHYPPDQVNIETIQRSYQNTKQGTLRQPPRYDPLAGDPDFILTGPWNDNVFKVYNDVIAGDQLVLERQIGGFRLFTRAR